MKVALARVVRNADEVDGDENTVGVVATSIGTVTTFRGVEIGSAVASADGGTCGSTDIVMHTNYRRRRSPVDR